MTTPCYKCEDRCIGCHTTCGDYAIYRKELETAKKAIIHKHLKKVGGMK